MKSTSKIIAAVEQVGEKEKDYTKLASWLDVKGTQDSAVTVDLVEPDPVPKRGAYEVIGQSVGRLVDEKQKAYGGIERVHAAMKVFYPEGVPVEKLNDALLVVRILDKLNRISSGDKAAFDENPFLDIAGYGLLGFTEED